MTQFMVTSDLLIVIIILLAFFSMLSKIRALLTRHDHYHWLRVWVILLNLVIIAIGVLALLGYFITEPMVLIYSEFIIICLLATEAAHAWVEW